MKLKEAKEAYYEFSGTLSAGVRNISFAGIAIVWIFRTSDSSIPSELLLPLVFFVSSLSFDIFHYAYASLAWRCYYNRCFKKKIRDDDEVDPPDYMNWPSEIFMTIKILSVCIGYVFIGIFLVNRIVPNVEQGGGINSEAAPLRDTP